MTITLTDLNRKIDQLTHAHAKVAEAEATLKTAKEALAVIEEQELPGMMTELSLTELTFAPESFPGFTGLKLEDSFHCSISEERREAAFAWLNANKLGDIIKRELKLSFGKKEGKLADEAAKKIRALFPQANLVDKPSVHPSTLKSTLQHLREDGVQVPEETFGVFTRTFARLVPVKE